MAESAWLAQRNQKALARLRRNLPGIFPGAVLLHALSRPFLPATPRRAVDSYWRHHPVRDNKLARALAMAGCAFPLRGPRSNTNLHEIRLLVPEHGIDRGKIAMKCGG